MRRALALKGAGSALLEMRLAQASWLVTCLQVLAYNYNYNDIQVVAMCHLMACMRNDRSL